MKCCQHDDAAVEVDDLGEILRAQALGEADRRFLRGRQLDSMLALVSSSSASAIGRLVRLKKVTSCLTPSSKTLKSVGGQIGHVALRAVGDRHVERDDLDAGAERQPGAGWLAAGL